MSDRDDTQAQLMLRAFSSVGVRAFRITLTDVHGVKATSSGQCPILETSGYRAFCPLSELQAGAGELLRHTTRSQLNLHIRPHRVELVDLIQLDDLPADAIKRIAPTAFLTLQTSPGNFQAWVAVTEATPEFASRLRQGIGADRTASGSVRLAGGLNFKTGYAPDFPTVKIDRVRPGCITTALTLEQAGFVAPAPTPSPRASARPLGASAGPGAVRRPRKWPSYERCLEGAPIGTSGNPKRSFADFTWCVIAIDWGWNVEATADRLLEESTKAKENGPRYALLTAQKAAVAVEGRRVPRSRPGPR